MRALLIGIGGAGSRIVNMLSAHEEKSNVKSVRAYIFDANRDDLNTMESIEPEKRIYLSPSSVDTEECLTGYDFDINHISGYFNDSIADEADAIFICAGLGGRMAETVPGILKQLNVTFADPVYTILTLPARNEGARVSARAAATLSEIRKEANASILFDNETWIQRLEDEKDSKTVKKQEKKGEEAIPHQPAKLSIRDVTAELNERLTRRVELLLRAGEITPNGLESAEAVLDAGEVLNTLTDSDIVSIGYAAEHIPKTLLGIFNRFRMEKYLLEEGHKRTARIVELAKQAVYEEVSIPCDLTTANKALVLITGPSNELSMKGFQTIRKWIDRSIKGLEMRAGDYPVHSSQDVGVIIVLAGIENVPRLAELNEIKASYDEEVSKKYRGVNDQTAEVSMPKLRPATDNEIFEECEVLSMNISVPFLESAEGAPQTGGVQEDMSNAAVAGNTERYTPEKEDETLFCDIWEVDSESPDFFEERKACQDTQYPGPQPEKKPESIPQMRSGMTNMQDSGDFFEEAPVSAGTQGSTDIFEERHAPVYSQESTNVFEETPAPANRDRDGDFFEERPVFVKHEPVRRNTGASYAAATYTGTSYTDVPLMPETPVAVQVPRRPDEKISLGPAKGRKVKAEEKIPLPPRNKQPDMVLAGQADLGMRKITKDTEDRVTPGSGQRPKETEREVSVGSGQRPKETERAVSVGSGQRPKDIDREVSVRSGLRPKEADGAVSVGSGQRPKDTDKGVAVRAGQKPKDAIGVVRLGTGQRPKEIGNVVRIGSAPKPKEAGTVIKVSRKQPAKETLSSVRTVQKQTETKEEKTSGTAHDIKWN